nr:hypothetical protein [uncultured Chryseobacterium sp.]
MRFLIAFLQRLYELISYYGIRENDSQDAKDSVILLNRYVVICVLILVSHSICNFFFFGITTDSLFLVSVSSSLFLVRFLLTTNIERRYFISVYLTILTGVVTYYSSFCGLESGMYLFYFPLLSCLPVLFSFKKDKFLLGFFFILIIVSLYASAIGNFTIVERDLSLGNYCHKLLLLNITCILLLMTVNLFFILEKKAGYFFIYHRNLLKSERIHHLNTEVNRLKKILTKEDFSDVKIEEVIKLIHVNDVVFVEKFEKLFPDFFIELHDIASVPLTVSDLKFCAMLKLGFSTKQIAIYTDSTIKSVEGKKYRLRKKLRISSGSNSKNWMSAI